MRKIVHIDMDAFYASVEQRDDASLRGRPVVVAWRGKRSVVCAASYEARKFGVRSAMPMARAVRLCPAAMVVPVPRQCGQKSREIARVLARYSPVVEGSSIDEWYLDMGGTERLYGDEPLAATAARIRQAVIDATGLTVSIGGGTSKLVAKLAVELAKPKPGTGATGVHIVEPGEEAEFMTRFALGDLPGVGPKSQERLAKVGLVTVRDALAVGEPALQRIAGEGDGEWLWRRIHGVDDSPVEPSRETKQMSREDTFPKDLHDDAALARELTRLAVRVSADLRGDGLRARTITVKIKDADFTTRSASRTLPEAVESERAIAAEARALLVKLRKARRVGVRLLGVALSGLVEESRAEPGQLALFAPAAAARPETDRDRALSHAVDRVREKFGSKSVVPGTLIDE
ncbi:MAG: DNA polymerase IV [Gemmatimonadaceae bacterium]